MMLHQHKINAVDITSATGNLVLKLVSWLSKSKFKSLGTIDAQRESPSRFIYKFDRFNRRIQ